MCLLWSNYSCKKQTVFKQINLLNFKWEIIGILDSIDIAFIP